MKLTTQTRYGLRTLIKLAEATGPVSSDSMAKTEGISKKFLDAILARLREAQLVESLRGRGGGFVLKKPPRDISLFDIFTAVGEPSFLSPCHKGTGLCPRVSHCKAYGVWDGLDHVIISYLKGQKLINYLQGNGGLNGKTELLGS